MRTVSTSFFLVIYFTFIIASVAAAGGLSDQLSVNTENEWNNRLPANIAINQRTGFDTPPPDPETFRKCLPSSPGDAGSVSSYGINNRTSAFHPFRNGYEHGTNHRIRIGSSFGGNNTSTRGNRHTGSGWSGTVERVRCNTRIGRSSHIHKDHGGAARFFE